MKMTWLDYSALQHHKLLYCTAAAQCHTTYYILTAVCILYIVSKSSFFLHTASHTTLWINSWYILHSVQHVKIKLKQWHVCVWVCYWPDRKSLSVLMKSLVSFRSPSTSACTCLIWLARLSVDSRTRLAASSASCICFFQWVNVSQCKNQNRLVLLVILGGHVCLYHLYISQFQFLFS